MTMLLILDVDGVLNSVHATELAPAPATELTTSRVGRWPVRWNPATMMSLRPLLEREDVVGAWCTTWLSDPHLLDDLEDVLRLDGLVPLRAAYPLVQPTPDRLELNPLFDEDVSLDPRQPSWWKLTAVMALIRTVDPDRVVWIDDDLPRPVVSAGLERASAELDVRVPIPTHLLVSPPREVGLRYGDVAAIRGWLNRTQPLRPARTADPWQAADPERAHVA